MYALSERLHIDIDEILAWPVEKLQRWQTYDEIDYMLKSARRAFKGMTDKQVIEVVHDEQERSDWRGVFKTAGEGEIE